MFFINVINSLKPVNCFINVSFNNEYVFDYNDEDDENDSCFLFPVCAILDVMLGMFMSANSVFKNTFIARFHFSSSEYNGMHDTHTGTEIHTAVNEGHLSKEEKV